MVIIEVMPQEMDVIEVMEILNGFEELSYPKDSFFNAYKCNDKYIVNAKVDNNVIFNFIRFIKVNINMINLEIMVIIKDEETRNRIISECKYCSIEYIDRREK